MKAVSWGARRQRRWIAVIGQGPQRNSPTKKWIIHGSLPDFFKWGCHFWRSHSPALFSWGVGSTTCQPSNSAVRSDLLIQHSAQTWKFLQKAWMNTHNLQGYSLIKLCTMEMTSGLTTPAKIDPNVAVPKWQRLEQFYIQAPIKYYRERQIHFR